MSTKKTAKKSSRKTTKKSANKATKKTAKKTTNKAARKVTKQSKRKAVKKAAKKTAKKAAKKVAKKVAKKAAKKVAKKTARKATKATKKKTANKTIKSKSTKKSAKKSTRKVATPRLVKPLRKRPKRSYARSSKKAPGLSRRAAQKPIKAWCSWCFDKSKHVQHTEHGIFRNEFQCRTCENYTKVCQVPSCSNRARSRPINECEEDKGFRKSIGKLWGGTFCAVHAGEIANFDTLGLKLRDLTQYPKLLERNSTNMAKVAKVGCGVAAGVSVVTPFACAAAPAIASAIGSAGLLGSAATGTMISSLSGAALTSASLAALGPAGMAGGVATITAIGGALGGRPAAGTCAGGRRQR